MLTIPAARPFSALTRDAAGCAGPCPPWRRGPRPGRCSWRCAPVDVPPWWRCLRPPASAWALACSARRECASRHRRRFSAVAAGQRRGRRAARLGLAAAAGVAVAAVPAPCLARCAAVSHAGQRAGCTARWRCRCRPARACSTPAAAWAMACVRCAAPTRSARLEGVEWSWPLALAARAACRLPRVRRADLWAQLGRLRPGVPVPAAREHAARAGQGGCRNAPRQPGWRAWNSRPPAGAARQLSCPDGRPLWLYRLPLCAPATLVSSGAGRADNASDPAA